MLVLQAFSREWLPGERLRLKDSAWCGRRSEEEYFRDPSGTLLRQAPCRPRATMLELNRTSWEESDVVCGFRTGPDRGNFVRLPVSLPLVFALPLPPLFQRSHRELSTALRATP